MKVLARLTRLLPILFIILFACQTEEEQLLEFDPEMQDIENFFANAEVRYLDVSAKTTNDMTPCGEAIEYPIMWYLSRSIGKITVYNTPDYFVVRYVLDTGFTLVKTELGIQIENDSSSYDSYVYPVNHDDGTQEFTYKIPLSDFNTLPDKLILKAEVAAWKEPGLKPGKLITALAKNLNLTEQKYLIEYYFQECDLVNEECPVNFQFGFGMPSVEVASSFSFNELGMEDWEWGYAHEIIDERLFRLPIKKDDDESAEILGQVTVMIDNDIAYVYFQMNDGYPMNKTGLYFSSTRPESGVPCDYTYNTEFTNPDGTWAPVLTYMYTINDLSQMLGTTSTGDDDNDDQKLNPFWIIAYTDFFE